VARIGLNPAIPRIACACCARFARHTRFEFQTKRAHGICRTDDLLTDEPDSPVALSGKYTHLVIYLFRKDCKLTRALLDKCRPMMAPGCECSVFLHHIYGEHEIGNFSVELVRYFDDIIMWPSHSANFHFAGGRLKRFNRQLFNFYGDHYSRSRSGGLLFLVPAIYAHVALRRAKQLVLVAKASRRRFLFSIAAAC
jgi:hypothetical protein